MVPPSRLKRTLCVKSIEQCPRDIIRKLSLLAQRGAPTGREEWREPEESLESGISKASIL